MRLIRWTTDPRINHEARINHVKLTVIALVSESGITHLGGRRSGPAFRAASG